MTGAALWAPPGHAKLPTSRVLRYLPQLLGALGTRSVSALRALDSMERTHPHEPPHWYLGVLGTTPRLQRSGIGSSLLAPVLERCDAEGLPAYLESSKESNIAFYARFGFEVTGEVRIATDGPTVWPMWREPR